MLRCTSVRGVPEDAYEVIDAQVHFGRDVGEGERLGQAVLHDGSASADGSVLTPRYAWFPAPGQQMDREERRRRPGVQVARLPTGRQRPQEVLDDRVARAQPGGYRLEVRLPATQLICGPLHDGVRGCTWTVDRAEAAT